MRLWSLELGRGRWAPRDATNLANNGRDDCERYKAHPPMHESKKKRMPHTCNTCKTCIGSRTLGSDLI